jgi:hypothetical protein
MNMARLVGGTAPLVPPYIIYFYRRNRRVDEAAAHPPKLKLGPPYIIIFTAVTVGWMKLKRIHQN